MNRRRWTLVLVLCAASPLAGCASEDHLFFSTYTKVGVDITATGGVPTSAALGYKRFEGAIIPVEAEDGTLVPQCASVFAAIDMDNRWLGGLDLFQVFATGKAAEQVAKAKGENGLAGLLKAMHDKAAKEKGEGQ